MQVTSQKVGPCKVKVIVKAEADETRQDYDEVLRSFMRKAQVPGFRTGKVPREIIKRDFHKELTHSVQARLFQALHPKALEQEGLDIVEITGVEDMLFSPETGLVFSMYVDIKPEFDLPKYGKMQINVKEAQVAEEEVEAYIGEVRRELSEFENTGDDHVLQEFDLACIDFSAATEKINPEHPLLKGRVDFWVQVNRERFYPELVEALVGMRSGESKEGVAVVFPEEAPDKELAGQKLLFSVTVKQIKVPRPLTDEELLQKTGAASLEELRTSISERFWERARAREREEREHAIRDFLLKKSDFDLPESQVRDEMDHQLDSLLRVAQRSGATREYLEEKRDSIIERVTETARRNVRLRHILSAIAKAEGLEVDERALTDEISQTVGELRLTSEQSRKLFENEDLRQRCRVDLLCRKALKLLMDMTSPRG